MIIEYLAVLIDSQYHDNGYMTRKKNWHKVLPYMGLTYVCVIEKKNMLTYVKVPCWMKN